MEDTTKHTEGTDPAASEEMEFDEMQNAQIRALRGMGFSEEEAKVHVLQFADFLGRIVALFEGSAPSAARVAALMLFADRLQLTHMGGKDARTVHELFTQAQRFMQARRARKGVV